MEANKSKDFQLTQERVLRKSVLEYENKYRNSSMDIPLPDLSIEDLLNGLFRFIGKLLIALKSTLINLVFQPLHNASLQWLRLGFLSLIAFLFYSNTFDANVISNEIEPQVGKFEERQPSKNTQFSTFAFFSTGEEKKTPIKLDLEDPNNLFAPSIEDNLRTTQAKEYIRRFAKVAITEMHKFGIPASIKMAQGLLESNMGESSLAQSNNNHFGIKCFSKKCVKGHCSNFNDDHHKDFFRKYKSSWASWRAHSKMIANGRYQSLISHGTNYKAWAKGLKKLGYATAPSYDKSIISLIEKYQLYKLDEL